MDYNNMMLKQAQCEPAGIGQYRPPTIRENLTRQQIELTERLANIEAALKALDENPNFENVMNVIQKAC